MKEAEQLKYTEYTSAFSSRWIAVLLALNVGAAISVWPISMWWAGTYVLASLWMYLFYRVAHGVAGYKSLLSMMSIVMEKKNKELGELRLEVDRLEIDQALADDGTKSYKYCPTVDKGEKDE